MITERDAESREDEQDSGNDEMEPIDPEVPQIKRHRGQSQKECADQKRTRRPINSIGGNSENQETKNAVKELKDQEVGRARITSCLVQVWTRPQCAQVNFCAFTLAALQRFSSIVLPVSVSFDVEGQRTSKLLMLAPTFDFARRGGSK